jgi:MSHA biogenesis protein MshK
MALGVAVIGCIGSFGWTTSANAQSLADPTRPPRIFTQDIDTTETASGPILQSVLISPGRRVAIISGQTVRVGEQVGTARVVKISDGEVVLRSGSDIQTLRLFPDIEKRSISNHAQKNAGQQKEKR